MQSEKKIWVNPLLQFQQQTQVTDEESQVLQIGSVVEKPQVVGMEKEEIGLSLVLIQLLKIQRCLNHLLIKRISKYGSTILILIRRKVEKFLCGLLNPFGKSYCGNENYQKD